VGEPTGPGVPDRLRWPVGGDQVDSGAVAVGVVAGFAGGADAQVVAPQDPDDVVVEAGASGARDSLAVVVRGTSVVLDHVVAVGEDRVVSLAAEDSVNRAVEGQHGVVAGVSHYTGRDGNVIT
jgi:hypothetical protein